MRTTFTEIHVNFRFSQLYSLRLEERTTKIIFFKSPVSVNIGENSFSPFYAAFGMK